METLKDSLTNRDSFSHLWALLDPKPEYRDRESACRGYWNALTLQRQRQIYWYLREIKRRGGEIAPNPLFVLKDVSPQPTNWNGSTQINEQCKRERMVSARYGDKYGIYTAFEAELFEMEDVKPIN